MDRETLFGGNAFATIIRLAVLSIIVGIVLSALDITPRDLLFRLRLLVQRVYDLGFGAVVVVPIWLLTRLFGGARSRDPRS